MVEGVLKNRLGLTDKPIRETVRIQSPTDPTTYLGYDSKFGFCSANQSKQVEGKVLLTWYNIQLFVAVACVFIIIVCVRV